MRWNTEIGKTPKRFSGEAAKSRPTAQAYTNHGIALASPRQHEAARTAFEQALRLDKRSAKTHYEPRDSSHTN